jgi:hypothetical protein
MSSIDLGNIGEDPTTDPAWRLHAVKLAVEKHLAGRAETVLVGDTAVLYSCVSQTEPKPHMVSVFASGSVMCDCHAGIHAKPCAHAGSVLLLHMGLAPENAIVEAEM